ncbi:MAG: sulfurtransferase [Dermatophilaceae bacterium]
MSRADVLITADELAALLGVASTAATSPQASGTPPPVLLDVRWRLGEPHGAGAQRYAAAHLPGACFLDLEKVLTRHTGDPRDGRHPLPDPADLDAALRALGVTPGIRVVVYDEAGSFAAGRAWWVLRWAGHDVRVLDGGIEAWIAHGYAVSSDPEAPAAPLPSPIPASTDISTPRSTDISTAKSTAPSRVPAGAHYLTLPLLSADDAAAIPVAGGVLVDVRAPERFAGETEPLDPVAGHIPGAINLPVSGLFASAADPHPGALPPESTLRHRLAPLIEAVAAGRPIGVYCGSGVSAAQAVLALATLGIEAPLYAGSWSAWSNDPSRPVATGPAAGSEIGPGPRDEPGPGLRERS